MREELEDKYDSFYIEIFFDIGSIMLFYHYIVFPETKSVESEIYASVAFGGGCDGTARYFPGAFGAHYPHIRY